MEQKGDAQDRKQAAIKLTSWMAHKHYCENDPEALISQFGEPFSWIGAGEQEYSASREQVTAAFRQMAGMVPECIISDEQYDAICVAPDVYVCSGMMWIRTAPSTGIALRVHQRITTVIRFTGDAAECCHIHISNPYADMQSDDIGFPHAMARVSREYLEEQVAVQKAQIEEQAAQMQQLSFTDTMTGLYNRNRFNAEMEADHHDNPPIGVAYFDLNGLKEVNDLLGHHQGDELLCRAAAHIKQTFAGKAYRIGGDEFAVIDHESDEDSFAAAVANVCARMEQDGIYCAAGFCWRGANCNIEEQLNEADRMMYAEKKRFYQERGMAYFRGRASHGDDAAQ